MCHMVDGSDCHIQAAPMEPKWLRAVFSVAPSCFLFLVESNKDLLLSGAAVGLIVLQ